MQRSPAVASVRHAIPSRALYLPPGWPIYALFVGFPLWWVLGLSAFILPVIAVPMAAWLFRQRTVLAPRGFGIWIAFLLWMLGSAVRVEDPDKYIQFAYTASLYFAVTILLLYIFNMPRDALPTGRIVTIMVIFWMFVVGWGVLGVAFPTVSFSTPVESFLPGRLASNEFVRSLVHPALAQVQSILGYEQPRPSAPFVYATNWAAAFGLLMPFVILAWKHASSQAWRLLIAITFAVGLVPVVSSLGRGLWLSLSVGLTYVAVRSAVAGKSKTLWTVVFVIAIALAMIYLTPLKGLVSDRFANPHSNRIRLLLYEESLSRVMESPLVGFGTPQPARFNPNAPPVGTQGQLWQVLVSHGIGGAVFFLGWFLFQFWRLRAASSDVGLWCHTLILISLVQVPYYDSIGIPLAVIMIAIAVASREARPRSLPIGDSPEQRRARPDQGRVAVEQRQLDRIARRLSRYGGFQVGPRDAATAVVVVT